MKVLIADDSIVSRHLLESILRKWRYEVVLAADGTQAWEILQRPDAPALAILDWLMPGVTGVEVCRRVREQRREPYTYILLLSSKSAREDLIAGMEAGADDYVVKPFDQHELNVRLRAGRRLIELQAELVATREALREQATKDALTGVWNRPTIVEILERELARSEREASAAGVILLDLDHFKNVNDSYGHFAGDAVLKEAALRLQSTVRPYDSIGRYGGEEFLVLLPGCDEQSTFGQAERLRSYLAKELISASDTRVRVTASFGCTSALPGRTNTAEAFIRKADEALYLAKKLGRNRVELLSSAPELSPRHGLLNTAS